MRTKIKKLSSNMEDYLETIASIKKEKGIARVSNIGRALNVKNSSVTAALNLLAEQKLVIHERYGYVDLTDEGAKIAQRVQKRHDALENFFINVLGIAQTVAAEDACKMEHSMSAETLDRMTKFIEFLEQLYQNNKTDCLPKFDEFYSKLKKK